MSSDAVETAAQVLHSRRHRAGTAGVCGSCRDDARAVADVLDVGQLDERDRLRTELLTTQQLLAHAERQRDEAEARLAAQQPVIDAADWMVRYHAGESCLGAPLDIPKTFREAVLKYRRAALSGSVEADTPAEPGEAPGRALLREVLDTLGMAGTRDWDDVLNVLRCWRKQREVADTPAEPEPTKPRYLASVCDTCGHTYNYHASEGVCAHVKDRRLCPCVRFVDQPVREVADTPAAEPAPDGWCCGAMLRATSLDCDRHSSAHECPDVLVLRDVREGGDYGLPVRDGGSSFVVIGYCPWCGADLLAGAGAPTEPADDTAPELPARRPRLRACIEAWPDCWPDEYNPSCCRFPKSCSCTSYDDERVAPDALEDMAGSADDTREGTT